MSFQERIDESVARVTVLHHDAPTSGPKINNDSRDRGLSPFSKFLWPFVQS